jgi:hypothetical protein
MSLKIGVDELNQPIEVLGGDLDRVSRGPCHSQEILTASFC